jgi:hypothetical protein
MTRFALCALAACLSAAAPAQEPTAVTGLTAPQIIEKNVAARGGLEAWRKVDTMAWAGRIESANGPAPSMQFLMEMKRPNKTRFEILSGGQMSVRIYDGADGWKLRPTSTGVDLQPYKAEELRFSHDGHVIDGPLIDHAAKGIGVALEGVEEVEGRKAYRLSLSMPSGARQRVWVDAETFLDVKYDREATNPQGRQSVVSVFYRDYRTVGGLLVPLVIESGAAAGKATDKLIIERVALNPELDERLFAKPNVPTRRGVATVGGGPPQAGRKMGRAAGR